MAYTAPILSHVASFDFPAMVLFRPGVGYLSCEIVGVVTWLC